MITTDIRPGDIKRMGDEDALRFIAELPIGELAGMTREIVEALPTDARVLRRQRLLDDDTEYDIRSAAPLFGTTWTALTKWRNNYLRTGEVGKASMPQSDFDLDRVREYNDGRTDRGVPPRWKGRTLRGWGARPDVGKMDADFFATPDRGGRPPNRSTDVLSPYA